MDSQFIDIPITCEITRLSDCYGNYDYVITPITRVPDDVYAWAWKACYRDRYIAEGWDPFMEQQQVTIRLEVEVEHDGRKVRGVTCHTECPNFIKAWAEIEARKQWEKEHVCTSS